MKLIRFLIALAYVGCLLPLAADGQRAPVKMAPVTTPKPSPAKPSPTPASPAETFFNDGLKCDAKDFDCQVSSFTKAINLGLSTKAVFQKRAASYMARGDYDKAIADLGKVIDIDPNDATSFKERGKAYISSKPAEYQDAINNFSSAIDLEPKDVAAFILRGQTYLSTGDSTKGVADIDNAVRLDPKNVRLMMLQAKVFSDYFRDPTKALEVYSRIVSTDPTYLDAYKERAKIFETEKKYELATEDYRKLILQTPNDPDLHALIAEVYVEAKRTDEAVNEYTKAIELRPAPDLFLKRAGVYRDIRRYPESIADISLALEKSPIDAGAYKLRCEVEKESRDLKKAVQDCSISAYLNPYLIDPNFLWSTIILEIKELDPEVQTQISKNYTERLGTHTTRISEADFLRNRRITAAMQLRKSPSATNYLNLASSEFGGNGECYGAGRVDLAGQNNTDSRLYCAIAESYYSAAIELDPNLTEAYVGRALSRFGELKLYNSIDELTAILQDIQKAADSDLTELELDKVERLLLTFPIFSSKDHSEESTRLSNSINDILHKTRLSIVDNLIEKSPRKAELYNLRGHISYAADDYKKSVAAYEETEKTVRTKEAFVDSVKQWGAISAQGYPGYFDIYVSDKNKRKKWSEFLDGMLVRYPENSEIYQIKCKTLGSAADCETAKVKAPKDQTQEERMKTVSELIEGWKAGEVKAQSLMASQPNHVATQTDPDKQLFADEAKRVEKDDLEALEIEKSDMAQIGAELAAQDAIIAQQDVEIKAIKQAIREQRRELITNTVTNLLGTAIQASSASVQAQRSASTASPSSQTSASNTSHGNPTVQSPGSVPTAGGTAAGSTGGCTPNDGTSRSPDWSACSAAAGETAALFSGTVVSVSENGPYDWSSCDGPDADNLKRCWGAWEQSGMSQVSLRFRGPYHEKYAGKEPYHWMVGFKNTSSGIVTVVPKLIFGDGTSLDGGYVLLTPGAEYQWDAIKGTQSNSPRVTLEITKWAYCPNAVRTSDASGSPAYKCVGR